MEIRRAAFLALLLLWGLRLDAAAAQENAAAGGAAQVRSQVDPGSDLAKLYPLAGSIGLAMAIVPDPHVPRYRRLFDLEIQAITLGMLNDGYVLDRYAFPWNDSIGDGEDSKSKPAVIDSTDGAFGLMIFRCDGWREHSCNDPATLAKGTEPQSAQTTRVRAIYLVTDTATWGVSPRPLACATRRIREQLAQPRPAAEAAHSAQTPGTVPAKACLAESAAAAESLGARGKATVELLRFPGRCDPDGAHKTLVVLGPNFSGAMDSIGEQIDQLIGDDGQVSGLCLVSSFTTDSSNPLAETQYHHLVYERLSVADGLKLQSLAKLAQVFGYFKPAEKRDEDKRRKPNNAIAFLTEASTFGYGVCNPPAKLPGVNVDFIAEFCRSAQTLYFPAAIADIRYGLDQQHERQKNDVQAAMKVALPSEHLTLEVGAENGSEFPESRQSKLTAASQQLALDHVLEQLEQFKPKMVIVVATDVRDRLFLFDQLRERLPSALLIDLETDILLAHPDFLHASRGAVTVASANLFVRWGKLFGCERDPRESGGAKGRIPLASWALDGQGMLADAVSRLHGSDPTPTEPPCILNAALGDIGARAPILHVVTLNGLRRISRAYGVKPASGDRAKNAPKIWKERQHDVTLGQMWSVVCCFLIALPWIWLRPLRRILKPVLALDTRMITGGAALAGLIVWLYAMEAAYAGDDPESGYALVYWSVAILVLALAGFHQCLKRVRESGVDVGELKRRYRYSIAVVGLFACALAAAPLAARYLLPRPLSEVLDEELMTRLALDISQGLAYDVVIAVGVTTVLAVMVALATGLCVMTRNKALLAPTANCKKIKPEARTPRFPMAAIVGVVAFVAFIGVPGLIPPLGSARLSIFGPRASMIATLVLVLTTLGASILTAIAIHASRRVRTIAAHIGRCVTPKAKPGQADSPGEHPGFWPANEWRPDLFAATPVVARVSSEDIGILNAGSPKSWNDLINDFLGNCDGIDCIDDGDHRRAVFALLASEVSLYRWFVGGAVLCALASVCAAYLFPIEADALLMWNLLLLVAHALLAGYVATAFERDGVLSNILCNRPKKAEFSASLFTYAALPFFALGFAIAVSQVPGVVDWGGGLLALLGAIGIHP